jgi:malate dehydrogenase
MGNARICIIGAGQVGTAAAAAIVDEGLGHVTLIDAAEGLATGKAMDINHARGLLGTDFLVSGYDDDEGLGDADVVVLTAGAPRKTGQSRQDLLAGNLRIATSWGERIAARCPRAVVLIVTNPVDALTWAMAKQWPTLRVMGLGCSLDAVRLRHLLALSAGVSAGSVEATVVGAHNNTMVPLLSAARIGGVPASEVLSKDELTDAAERTRTAGATIVAYLKTRGSFYAAARTVSAVVRAICRDSGAVFPVSVPSAAAVDRPDLCLALPAAIGAAGIGRVLPPSFSPEERDAWEVCCEQMAAGLAGAENLLSPPCPR